MDKIYYIPASKKVMSLTFDDGVDSYTTPIILNILKKYNIKATFFVLIANILKNPKILQQLIDDGHSVQLHGWNHRNNKYYLILYWNINFSDPNKSFVVRIINPFNTQKIIAKYPNPLSMNEWPQQIEIDPNDKKIIFVESENNFVQLK